MLKTKKILLLLSLIISSSSYNTIYGQKLKYRGFSYYTAYDDTYTSPESRHKNGFSLALKGARFTDKVSSFQYQSTIPSNINPEIDSIINKKTDYSQWIPGVSFGFHYMFLKQKKLTFYKKERTEFNSFNIYFTPYFGIVDTSDLTNFNPSNSTFNNKKYINTSFSLKLTYSSPFFSYRGKLFNFYFLNEIGIDFHKRNPIVFPEISEKSNKAYFTIDPFRLKLGKGKLFFTSNINIAFDSTPLQPNKIEANANAGIQLFFYKTK